MKLTFLNRKMQATGIKLFLLFVMMILSVCMYFKSDKIIHFSRKSGFYEDSFYLELEERKGYTFYYTTDGSKPDMMSQKYTEPILVEDVSGKDNIYSVRKDISSELDEEELQKFGQEKTNYISPEEPVDKCNVIRVAAYDRENRLAAEATEVYFIGFQEKSGYNGIRKISLVTEPENLFDDEFGIYVTGGKYNDYTQKGKPPWERSANYQERGREWEREALIDVFDQNGEKLFSSECGIRIHGGVTRSIPQKSFNVYARTEYGGERRFPYDLFENGVGPHKFILSSGGNDDAVKVRDCVLNKMAVEANLDVATMKMFPCVLFLNGEYWGVYYVTESYNAPYVEDRYGVAENNVVIVKKTMQGEEIEDGNAADIELYHEMTEYVSSHDMQDGDSYQKVCEMIDIDSFVDYYALQIYIGNYDWPGNNVALWRAREENPLNTWADGRWRYMLFDTNNPSVFGDPVRDDLTRTIAEDEVFASLIQNEEVRQKFRERIRQLEDEVFCSENQEKIFDQWYDEMNESVKKSQERFFDMAKIEDIPHDINSMKYFLMERPAYMEKHMSECFQ